MQPILPSNLDTANQLQTMIKWVKGTQQIMEITNLAFKGIEWWTRNNTIRKQLQFLYILLADQIPTCYILYNNTKPVPHQYKNPVQ